MRVALSGASGFIGSALQRRWQGTDVDVQALPRLDLAEPFDLRPALQGAEVLVHAAARAHVLRERCADPLARFRAVNVQGSVRLVEQAAAVGVRRFVLLSSIGVLGQDTTARGPFQEEDRPNPQEPYAHSKWEAEQALTELAASRGMELVIVRPPLVCGPGAPGNLLRLLRLVDRGWPLPLASLQRRRSFLSLENLCDLLQLCLSHPQAPGPPLLAADAASLTLPEVLRALASGLNRPLRLLPLPPVLLGAAAAVAGRGTAWRRLSDALEVDASATERRLGWRPRGLTSAALQAMARAYSDRESGR
jgi:nucleoside-diphosphate-sugar epimerase